MRATIHLFCIALLIPGGWAVGESEGPAIAIGRVDRAGPVDFETEILPIFRSSCLACHNRKRAKADLILETPADIQNGGENGEVVTPGHAAESSLLQVAAHQVKPIMPPRDNKVSAVDLTPAQLGLLRLWIEQGAKGEVHNAAPIVWQPPAAALQPIYAVAVTPDGRFAAAGRGNRVQVYDLPTTRAVVALSDPAADPPLAQAAKDARQDSGAAHHDMVESLAFSPDGSLLASGSFGEIKLWRRARPASKPARQPAALSRIGAVIGAALGAAPPAGRIDGAILAKITCGASLAPGVAARERAMRVAAGEVAYFKALIERTLANQKVSADRLAKAAEAKVAAEKAVIEKSALLSKAESDKSAAESALAADPELARAEQLARTAERMATEAQKLAVDAKAPLSSPSSPATAQVIQELDAAAQAMNKAAASARAAATAVAALPRLKPLVDKVAAIEKARAAADLGVKNATTARATAMTEYALAEQSVRKAGEEGSAAESAAAKAQQMHNLRAAEFAAAQQAMKVANIAPIRSVAFSPDHQLIASAGDDGLIHLWSTGGVLLESFASPSIALLTFTPDGELLAMGARGSTLWNLGGRWTLERTLGTGDATSPLADRVNALAFSPDGSVLASGSGEPSRGGQIRLWEVKSGKPLQSFDEVHSDAVLALAFSPDGKYLASGAADRFVRVIDPGRGKVIKSMEGHTHHVLGVSWKADGRLLASAGADNQIRIWEVATADRRAAVGGFNKEVTGVHFFGTAGEAIAVAADGQLKIINDTGGIVRALRSVNDFVHAAAVTEDGGTLVVGGQSGVLTVWRGLTEAPAASFPAALSAH